MVMLVDGKAVRGGMGIGTALPSRVSGADGDGFRSMGTESVSMVYLCTFGHCESASIWWDVMDSTVLGLCPGHRLYGVDGAEF
jgi:hypothetical protein